MRVLAPWMPALQRTMVYHVSCGLLGYHGTVARHPCATRVRDVLACSDDDDPPPRSLRFFGYAR